MSLIDIQKQVDEWTNQFTPQYFKPLSIIAKLSEELGELSKEINDRYGDRVKKSGEDTKDIGSEICDIIFALTCLANSHNINLDESWKSIMKKFDTRDHSRFERKDQFEPFN